MKIKVLITGVTGFVGRNLVNYLRNDKNLILFGVGRNKEKNAKISHLFQKVFTYDELYSSNETFDIYIHLAGQVIRKNDKKIPESDYRESNLVLTQEIYSHFLNDYKSNKFFFFSSIHVLTDKPLAIVRENFTPKPFTPYGKYKYEAENFIKENSHSEKHYYIIRPTMIHGPGNNGNLKSLFEYIKAGYPYLFDSLDNYRSFLSIENLCFIIHEMIKQTVPSGLYHLADDEPTSTRDLIALFEEALQIRVKRVRIPWIMLKIASQIGQFLPIPFDDQRFTKLTNDFLVSNEKIITAIGKPLPVSSREGMKRTIESFLMNEIDKS